MTATIPDQHDTLANGDTLPVEDVDEAEPVATSADEAAAAVERWKSGDDLIERPERLPDGGSWAQMSAMATALATAPTMPAHIRNSRDPVADLMVVLLSAHDLGLTATVALQKVHVIDGKPAMAAELMRMLARRDGHRLWCEVDRQGGEVVAVTWYGVRKDDPDREHAATFTIEEARAADLTSKKVWKQYREDMLSARATSRLCRRAFEDSLAGVSYTPEELGAIETAAPIPAELPPPCSEAILAEWLAKIDALTPAEQALVRERWKDARIGSLHPGGQAPVLRVDQQTTAERIIFEAKRDAEADAEVVGEDDGTEQHRDSQPSSSTHPDPETAPFVPSPGSTVLKASPVPEGALPPCDTDAAENATEAGENEDGEAAPDPVAQITAEVNAMSADAVYAALIEAKLSGQGAPKATRARLIAHRIMNLGSAADF